MSDQPLTIPTDIEILTLLSTGDRQTPANVGAHLDQDSRYMSQRLRNLEERGYVRDAPPAERSGMYELTKFGAIAAFHIHTYVRGYHNTFRTTTEGILENQPNDAFYPDLIILDDADEVALRQLSKVDGLTVPSELPIKEMADDVENLISTVSKELYTLFYFGLAERVEDMDVYRITDRGEKALDLLSDDIIEPVELTDRLRETYTDSEREQLNTLLDVET